LKAEATARLRPSLNIVIVIRRGEGREKKNMRGFKIEGGEK
jgi:hypothetical protein